MAVRDAYNIPLNQIFESLEGFPADRFVEVMEVVQSYCRYWDEFGNDDGFGLPEMSDAARSTWNSIKKILHKSNSSYFSFLRNQSEKGIISAEVREEKQDKRAKERQRYVDNREEILKKRRVNRAEQKKQNLPNLQTTAPDSCPQSQSGKDLAENSTAVDGLLVIGLNNQVINNSVVIEERGCGGKQFIHSPLVDNSKNNDQSTSLTGNNPEASQGNYLPNGNGNNPHQLKADAEAKGNKQRVKGKGHGEYGSGQKASPPTQPSPNVGEGDNNSARKCLCRGSAAKVKRLYRWKSGDEVLVDEDFTLDFLDPSISDLNFIHDWLICGVTNKVKLWHIGKSIHKRWVRKLIFTFAKNQGYGEELAKELFRRSEGRKK